MTTGDTPTPSAGATRSSERSTAARYLFALVATVVGLVAALALLEIDEVPVYAPLIGAVALTAWYGGVGPALAVVVVGWTAAVWLLLEPHGGFALDEAELTRWLVNLLMAMVIAGVSGILRVREHQAVTVAVEAEESGREMERLQRLAAALSSAVSSSDVARVLREHAHGLVGADGVALGLVESGELVMVDTVGIAARASDLAGRHALDEPSIITRAARGGTLIRIDEPAHLQETYPRTAARFPKLRAAIAQPLRAGGGEIMGAVEFLFEGTGEIDEETEAAAGTIARLAEQALERARLYEREQESRQSLDRILRVAPRFHADTTGEVTEAICREARQTFGCDLGSLWRIKGNRIQLVRIDPAQPSLSSGREWALEDFPGMLTAARTLEVTFVADALEEARGAGQELVRTLGTRSSLRTPIVIGGRAELVLALSWQAVVQEPDPSTIAIVRRFADQAGLALEELERRRAEASAARRAEETRRLQEVTAALSLAATPLDVSNTCLEHAVSSVEADAAFVVLTGSQDGSPEIVTSSGLDDEELETWRRFGLDDDVPFARAIAGREPVWALSRDTVAAFADAPALGDAGWVALPLQTAAGVRGAVQLSFRNARKLSDTERRRLQNVVSQCAQAFERSRLFEDEQLLRARAERAQSLTAALSNALTPTDVAEAVVHEIGAAIDADGVALGVALEDRRLLKVLASGGYAAEVEPLLEISLDARTPATLAVTRRASFFFGSKEELRDQFPDTEAELRPLGHTSFLFSPLVAGRRANGLLIASWSEPPPLAGPELRFVESLVSQAAQALERASHFESERTIAETLQRSVLPVSLPRVEGIRLAARYLPGTAELDVGGDWFDAMQLPDGRVGLVVGDVVGKGVAAAASMGQLRNALRAFSVDRLKPSSVLARLNRLAEGLFETIFATIVYVVADAETRTCRIASAGHPPPVVVYPDDRVQLLEGSRGLPLGTGIDAKYRQDVLELPAGTVLILYSDGLVERRGRSIDEGFAELCSAVRDAPRDPERLLERILDRVVGSGERGDDIALLAAQFLPVAPRPLDLRISNRTGSLDIVRDALRVWLDGTSASRTDAEDVLLAVWEACANAVEHASAPPEGTVRVSASLEDSKLRIVIEDSGRWAPAIHRPDRGLGLRLMRSMMSSVDIETDEDGTRVTIEKTVDRAHDGETAPASGDSIPTTP